MLRLYYDRSSPDSNRARIALVELGLEYEPVELSTTSPHPKELLGKTPVPFGVPVLYVSEEFVLWGPASIMYWLDAAYPGSLTPSSRELQSLARAWVEWVGSFLYKPLANLRGPEEGKRAWAERRFRTAFAGIETMLDDHEWVVGNHFSIADVALASALVGLPRSLVEAMPKKLHSYVDRLRERPSVRAVFTTEGGSRPSWAA